MIVVEGEASPQAIAALSRQLAEFVDPSLGDLVDHPIVQLPSVRAIIDAVAFEMGLHRSDITGPGHAQRFMRGRCAVSFLARRLTGKSTPQIGRAMGDRDHSTILHQIARADELRASDPAFKLLTDKLIRQFEAAFAVEEAS